MPAWVLVILSISSYALIGVTLGLVYRLIVSTELFSNIKNVFLLELIRCLVAVAVLFPVWNFIFGFLGGSFGFSPTNAQGWQVSLGIGVSIALFKAVTTYTTTRQNP